MKKFITACLLIISVGLIGTKAFAITINFNEEPVPNLTVLDSTSYFSSYGISFEDQTVWLNDSSFIEDEKGLYSGEDNGLVTILWSAPISLLSFNYTAQPYFNATAYDSVGNVVDTFQNPVANWEDETGILIGGAISKVTWEGDVNMYGIDSITYGRNTTSVPEPATMLLFGAGLAGFAFFRNQKENCQSK